MKKMLGVSLVCILLICICLFSGAFASESDTVDSERWNMLLENFDPLDEYQVGDTSANTADFVEPKVSAELEMAMKGADPRSAVSYDPSTGEVSFTPYAALEKGGVVETPPSHVVSEDADIDLHLTSDN